MNSTFNYIAGGTLLRRQVVHFYSGLDRYPFPNVRDDPSSKSEPAWGTLPRPWREVTRG